VYACGTELITSNNRQLHVLDKNGNLLFKKWTASNDNPICQSIVVSKQGLVYVGFLSSGSYSPLIDIFTEDVDEPGMQFLRRQSLPYLGTNSGSDFRLAIHEQSGNLFVSQYGSRSVKIFDMNGDLQKAITVPDGMRPSHIALSSSGLLYIDAKFSNRGSTAMVLVYAYNHTTNALVEHGPAVSGKARLSGSGGAHNEQIDVGQLNSVSGLAVSPSTGLIYLSEAGSSVVQVFNGESHAFQYALGSYGQPGGQADRFNGPSHVAIADGRLYVMESTNHRVSVFQEPGIVYC
jgi:DNA-binding beta-propeller fold protein YncE